MRVCAANTKEPSRSCAHSLLLLMALRVRTLHATASTSVCLPACLSVCLYVCLPTNTQTETYTHTHRHRQTHTHTHTAATAKKNNQERNLGNLCFPSRAARAKARNPSKASGKCFSEEKPKHDCHMTTQKLEHPPPPPPPKKKKKRARFQN